TFLMWLQQKIDEIIEWVMRGVGPYNIPVLAIIIPTFVIALIIAITLFARRARVRRAKASTSSLAVWQEDDERGVDELTSAAGAAAARGDYSLAVVEQFRALALLSHQ